MTEISAEVLGHLAVQVQESLPNTPLSPEQQLGVATAVVNGYLAIVDNNSQGPALGTVLQRADGAVAQRINDGGVFRWRVLTADGGMTFDEQATPSGSWTTITEGIR